MKRLITLALAAILVFSSTLSVGAQAKPADGWYFAEEADFASSGWKDMVVLQVKGGKIVSVNWNGINNKGLADKDTVAAAGGYGMVKASKLGKEWHEQAAAVEQYLVSTQNTAFSTFDAAGKTDAITGASMTVKTFYDLVKKALAAGPVAKGTYAKDGWFYAKAQAPDKSGFFATALVTIVNGRIVSVNLNAVHQSGGDSKFVRALKGAYKMNAAQGEWNIQIARVEAAIIQKQGFSSFAIKSDGKTDAITGVSVMIGEYGPLFETALKGLQ